MQSELHSSFERVEQALQRLTDSIAAYNPSTTAAEELAVADDAVTADLKRLVTHQRNSARLAALRTRSSALDADIKGKIRALADTRRELLNIPAYDASSDGFGKEIDVQELLRYAKFISKTSVPLTVPKMRAEPAKLLEGAGGGVKKEEENGEGRGDVKMVNGTSSPTQAPEGEAATATAGTGGAEGKKDEKETATIHALTKGHRTFINQTLRFEPWPEHLTIQRGALGAIQRYVDAGVDPGSVLSAEEKEARRREEEEERERLDRERLDRERDGVRRGSVWQGSGGGGGGGRRGREEVFNPDDM